MLSTENFSQIARRASWLETSQTLRLHPRKFRNANARLGAWTEKSARQNGVAGDSLAGIIESSTRAAKSRVLQCDEQLATSRLLFLAEFLKCGIGAQRVPERIKP